MTIYKDNEQAASENNLLTPQEQAICEQIAASEAPHSQHAMALLALNERNTRAQAAEQAGLSMGQVKYWIAKFRKQRLDIFPSTLLNGLEAEGEAELVTEIEKKPESVTEKADSAEKKTKDTKTKKGKKAKKKTKKTRKKSRKSRKDKKSKKAKKTGKKTKKK